MSANTPAEAAPGPSSNEPDPRGSGSRTSTSAVDGAKLVRERRLNNAKKNWALFRSDVPALIGAVVAFAFFAITAVVMYFTAESSPTTMAAGVLGGFLVKIVGFMGVGIALRGRDFYDPLTLFLTLAVAAIASLIADVVIVQRARLPIVDESAR